MDKHVCFMTLNERNLFHHTELGDSVFYGMPIVSFPACGVGAYLPVTVDDGFGFIYVVFVDVFCFAVFSVFLDIFIADWVPCNSNVDAQEVVVFGDVVAVGGCWC